jgi:hypothetical protein
MTEIVQASSDSDDMIMIVDMISEEMSNALCDTFKLQLKLDNGFISSKHKGMSPYKGLL